MQNIVFCRMYGVPIMAKKIKKEKPQRVSRLEGQWLETSFAGRTQGKRSLRRKERQGERASGQRVPPLEEEQANATVTEVYPQLCRARLDDSGAEPLCAYRRVGVFFNEFHGLRQRSPVSVGDRVRVKAFSASDGVVEGICQRKNQLARMAPGKEGAMAHVMAANLDALLIVSSVKDPTFNFGIVDRFLVAARAAEIPVCVLVNKVDLLEEDFTPREVYLRNGVEVLLVSAKTGQGLEALSQHWVG